MSTSTVFLFLFAFLNVMINVVECGYVGKENATLIQLNTVESLSTTTSPNYFKFVLSTPSFVSISAKPRDLANTASVQIDLIDSNETFFGSAGTAAGADLGALLVAGTYILYMPNAVSGFTLSVNTSVCGDDGVAAPTATNVAAATALEFYANRSDPIPIWFCPPNVPASLFFRIRVPQPGTVSLALSTQQQFAPIFGSTLTLLAADGSTVLSTCGNLPVEFSSGPACAILLNKTDDFVIARVTRADKIAGGRLRLQLGFDTCLPDQWEPNGLPPATPVDELGSVFVGANLCIGDHDFFRLPASAGAKVVGARIDGEPADWMIRVIQRKGDTQNYADSTLALSEPARSARKVGAWVLLPDDATQVFLEIQLNTSGTVVPRYNLSVAIGFPYEIDITMFENENTTTTTMATETLTTIADAGNGTTWAPVSTPGASTTAPSNTSAPAPMIRKRGIDETTFSSSASATLADQVQAILNDFGDLVPVVQGVTSKALGLLLPAPNNGKFSQVETLLRAKLAEQRTVARFAALNIKLVGMGRTVAVTAPPSGSGTISGTTDDSAASAMTSMAATTAAAAVALAVML
jgi:hypothetical protein